MYKMQDPDFKVLGVVIDTTLAWKDHITATVRKIQSKIHAIRTIQRYFIKKNPCNPSLHYACVDDTCFNSKLKNKAFANFGENTINH
jgi:hypothetical protein